MRHRFLEASTCVKGGHLLGRAAAPLTKIVTKYSGNTPEKISIDFSQ
jgi:hypothetical protein